MTNFARQAHLDRQHPVLSRYKQTIDTVTAFLHRNAISEDNFRIILGAGVLDEQPSIVAYDAAIARMRETAKKLSPELHAALSDLGKNTAPMGRQ